MTHTIPPHTVNTPYSHSHSLVVAFVCTVCTADSAVPWTGSFSANGTSITPSTLRDISRWTRRLGCSAMSEESFNDGTFSNLVWPECRDDREVELMTVRNGVHAWWTKEQGGFETMKYVLAFFTRTWERQNRTRNVEKATLAWE